MPPKARKITQDQSQLSIEDNREDESEEPIGDDLWEEYESRVDIPIKNLEKRRGELATHLNSVGVGVKHLTEKSKKARQESDADFKKYIKSQPGGVKDKENLLNPINISPKMFGSPTYTCASSIYIRETSRLGTFTECLDELTKTSFDLSEYLNDVDDNLIFILKEVDRAQNRIKFLEKENKILMGLR